MCVHAHAFMCTCLFVTYRFSKGVKVNNVASSIVDL